MSLRIAGRIFTPRLAPTILTAMMLAILIGLGTWQMHRLHWKENLIATIDDRMHRAPIDAGAAQGDVDYLPAMASGTFLDDKTTFLYGISLDGKGGYHVLTPLRMADGRVLLVDRGWIPYDARTTKNYAHIDGVTQLSGLLRVPHASWISPANKPQSGDWFTVDLTALGQAMGAQLLPYYLEAGVEGKSDALPIGGQTRVTLPNNHLEYVLTWYGLALILGIIYLTSSFQKPDRD